MSTNSSSVRFRDRLRAKMFRYLCFIYKNKAIAFVWVDRLKNNLV
ncbi:MAG: hypothetical protein ACRC2R_12405 [Xenococcaceae cyanobacterium]